MTKFRAGTISGLVLLACLFWAHARRGGRRRCAPRRRRKKRPPVGLNGGRKGGPGVRGKGGVLPRTGWKDADPDIPILKEAKAEYAKLQ